MIDAIHKIIIGHQIIRGSKHFAAILRAGYVTKVVIADFLHNFGIVLRGMDMVDYF